MISLPNELVESIINATEKEYLKPYLFVSKFTFQLVCQKVYKRVNFPDNVQEQDILTFCYSYGHCLKSMKLPHHRYFTTEFYQKICMSCPNLEFLQCHLYPKQMFFNNHKLCLMSTNHMDDQDIPMHTVHHFHCCPSAFIFPNESASTLTHISHYFHHPGALSHAILPTFGPDLISLTLNPYDILTYSVAKLIVTKCPKLRYLVAPFVKSEGVWLLLRWCHTLSTLIVGYDPLFQDNRLDIENQRAVESINYHKRVWCVHRQLDMDNNRLSWHIGIVPKL